MRFQMYDESNQLQDVTGVITDSMVFTRVKNADYNLDFTIIRTPKNENIFNSLEEDSVIFFDNQKYVVKLCPDNAYSKAVTCVHEFYELNDDYVESSIEEGIYSPDQLMQLIFSMSPDWSYQLNTEGLLNVEIEKFGESNPIALLQQAMELLDAEFDPDSNGKVVRIAKRLGEKKNFSIEFKKNIVDIQRSVESSNVKTAVRVYYNRLDTGEYNGSVVYESPNSASYRRLKWEKPLFLDDVLNATEALEIAANSINDVPNVSISTSFVSLRESGYNSDIINLGDTINLIDKRFKEFGEVRINQITRYPLLKGKSPDIVLQNRPKNIFDSIIKQQENRNALDKIVIKQTEIYDGVKIDKFGLTVESRSGLATIHMNGDDGITIRRGSIRTFYVDPSGNVVMDGRLRVTNGDGVTTLLEAFKDSNGGVFKLYDNDSNLNVRIGSEGLNSPFRGGVLQLFHDDNALAPRIDMGIRGPQFTQQGARMLLRDKEDVINILLDTNTNGIVRIENGDTFQTAEMKPGSITVNGSEVATRQWVVDNFLPKP